MPRLSDVRRPGARRSSEPPRTDVADPVRLIELRVLEGPNLYFTRPAIKLTLAVPGWLTASDERILAIAERLGVPGGARTGPPESEQRRRVVARMAAFLTRRIAVAGGARRLAVRARPGQERRPDRRGVPVAPARRRRGARERGRRGYDVVAPPLARSADRRGGAPPGRGRARRRAGRPRSVDPRRAGDRDEREDHHRPAAGAPRSERGQDGRVLVDGRRVPRRRRADRVRRLLGLRRSRARARPGARRGGPGDGAEEACCCEASACGTTTSPS